MFLTSNPCRGLCRVAVVVSHHRQQQRRALYRIFSTTTAPTSDSTCKNNRSLSLPRMAKLAKSLSSQQIHVHKRSVAPTQRIGLQHERCNTYTTSRSAITCSTSTTMGRRQRALLGRCVVLAAAAAAATTCTAATSTFTTGACCLFMMLPSSSTAAAALVRHGPSFVRQQRHASFTLSFGRLGSTRTTSRTASTAISSSKTSIAAKTTDASTTPSSAPFTSSSSSSQQQSLLLTETMDNTVVALRHSDFFTDYNHDNSSKQRHGAPPVVFLHGLLGNRRNFATIARSLAAQLQTKRRLLAVDLRNHGDSVTTTTATDSDVTVDQTRPSMTYTEMAADVFQFLDTHQLEKAVLVGHSMGGKVAQALALLAPERVAGLVVLDMAPVSYSLQDPHWKAVVDILHVLHNYKHPSSSSDMSSKGNSKKQVETYLQNHIPDPALRAFCLTNWNTQTGTWKIPMQHIVQSLQDLADFSIPQDRQYTGDVFLIHGGQSRFVRHSYIPTIAQYFPNHLLTTIKGAGHWVHAEAPEDTTALLKRYLDR